MKALIGVYTNQVKSYCDEEFFLRLNAIAGNNSVIVVDNSIGTEYFESLKTRFKYPNFYFYHIETDYEPKNTRFLRNVAESANLIRDKFLKTSLPYLLIIESDVLPPRKLLDQLEKSVARIEGTDDNPMMLAPGLHLIDKPWGGLGALYYEGFHDYSKKGVQKIHHVLSGCTLYKRELIEEFPFRWSYDNLGAFPDAWICYDSGQKYSLWNDHDIKCEHRENKVTGSRYTNMNY